MTPADILKRFGEMEGADFETMSEPKIKQRVGLVKAALRWAWKTDNPLFAFPFTMDGDTVDVTDGLIALADLGDGSLCSLWTEDPRPAGNNARPLGAATSNLGVHPRSCEGANLTSCFAFFRKAVPTFDYAEGGLYATPTDIPEQLLDMVALKALSSLLVATKQWESVNALKASYEDPGDQKEAMMAALLESKMVWQGNMVAIAAASA